MIAETAQQLRRRLRAMGLSNSAINAAWPSWWSRDAETSSAARADLRFSLARNLGLDPRSLLAVETEPRFVWDGSAARFKNLVTDNQAERDAITSYGKAVATLLLAAVPSATATEQWTAADFRHALLGSQTPFIRLSDLLALAWSLGIPVAHLRVFPGPHKRMAAMTIRVRDRHAILLGKDSKYPAPVGFYLAHEVGHVALGHLERSEAIVDFEQDLPRITHDDPEETAADEFALELLTGERRPQILPATGHASGRELARVALAAGPELRIEPGTLALGFGYSTSRWKTANAALKYIYAEAKPVWKEVNSVAVRQLKWDLLPQDTIEYLQSVLGLERE
jgi:hypothetical protein